MYIYITKNVDPCVNRGFILHMHLRSCKRTNRALRIDYLNLKCTEKQYFFDKLLKELYFDDI